MPGAGARRARTRPTPRRRESAQELGGEVDGCAREVGVVRIGWRLHRSTQSEVEQGDAPALFDEDVRRLYVAMEEATLVKRREPLRELTERVASADMPLASWLSVEPLEDGHAATSSIVKKT